MLPSPCLPPAAPALFQEGFLGCCCFFFFLLLALTLPTRGQVNGVQSPELMSSRAKVLQAPTGGRAAAAGCAVGSRALSWQPLAPGWLHPRRDGFILFSPSPLLRGELRGDQQSSPTPFPSPCALPPCPGVRTPAPLSRSSGWEPSSEQQGGC